MLDSPRKNYSGLAIELSRYKNCNECKKPIINQGTLTVSRYRGTAAASAILHYHKDCIFKGGSAIHALRVGKRQCYICGKDGTRSITDFQFKYKCSNGALSSFDYGGYHKSCVEKFVKENESRFLEYDSSFKEFLDLLNNGEYEKCIKKAKRVDEVDILLDQLPQELLSKMFEKDIVLLRKIEHCFRDKVLSDSVKEYFKNRMDKLHNLCLSDKISYMMAFVISEIKEAIVLTKDQLCEEAKIIIYLRQLVNEKENQIKLEQLGLEYNTFLPKLNSFQINNFLLYAPITYELYRSFENKYTEAQLVLLKSNRRADERVKLDIECGERILCKSF